VSALDELRFAGRILNLHEGLPPVAAARDRADRWLREQQVRGAGEVLVITGRGSHSPDGQAAIKPEIERLLRSLRRLGVIVSFQEHNPGAFAIRLAPIRAMVEAPPRRREPPVAHEPFRFEGLSPGVLRLARELAEASLAALGVAPSESNIENEIHRQLRAIAPAVAGSADLDSALGAALRAAIAEYD